MREKRIPWTAIFAVAAILGACILPGSARAGFNVNINIGAPAVAVAEPAEVALIPGFGVYFVPGGHADLFFYGGFWWSPRGDRWYRSSGHNGPWVRVERRRVPRRVIRVPRDYRVRYRRVKHVPYGQWKKTRHRRFRDEGRDGGPRNGRNHGRKGRRGHGRDD